MPILGSSYTDSVPEVQGLPITKDRVERIWLYLPETSSVKKFLKANVPEEHSLEFIRVVLETAKYLKV
jgi:hypothetical protein